MTKPLEPEVKRLRSLAAGELADEAGAAHAALARIKEEAIRRNLRRIDGALFRLTLSEPGRHMRLDRRRLEDIIPGRRPAVAQLPCRLSHCSSIGVPTALH